MVGRVALATHALFLILLIVTPHLVLARHGGGKKGRGGGRKPARPYKPIKRPAPHKPAVVPHKPVVNRKPAAPYRPNVQRPRPTTAAHVGPGANAGRGNGAGITNHGGPLFSGEVNISILFYGQWQSRHKDLIMSFLNSFGIPGSAFGKWKGIVEGYSGKPITFKVGGQQSDDKASLGKALNKDFIKMLVQKVSSGKPNTVAVILAHKDIGTSVLCRGKCYDHGSFDGKLPYLLVANPEVECPGACALPFTKASYGPPGPVVKPPNGDMGVDATIVNFAAGLASVVTNPLNGGFSKPGPKTWPIEAGNACEANFGRLTTDPAGVGYNAVGEKNLKFVLPAIWNPKANSCWAPM